MSSLLSRQVMVIRQLRMEIEGAIFHIQSTAIFRWLLSEYLNNITRLTLAFERT